MVLPILQEVSPPKVASGAVKLLVFQFTDPYQEFDCFEEMEAQLASYFSAGWGWLRGSMTSMALREEESPNFDNAPWGLALFSLRFNSEYPLRKAYVKLLPITFRNGYAENLTDGEKWLTAYLAQGWELLADFIFTGVGDGELAANTWGVSFMLLRYYVEESDKTAHYPEFFCSGHLCPQNIDCHACNY